MLKSETLMKNIHLSTNAAKKLPDGTFFYFDYQGGLIVEVNKNVELKKLRSRFGRVLWKKEYKEYAQTWSYSGITRDGTHVVINGVTEAPAKCRAVTETVVEKRQVAIGYREEEVTVERVRYICPGDKSKES